MKHKELHSMCMFNKTVTHWLNPPTAPPWLKYVFTFCSSCGIIGKLTAYWPPTKKIKWSQ